MTDVKIAVLGATGVTGAQAVAHLAAVAGPDEWLAAGRDPARVRRVLDAAGADGAQVARADVDDPGSLRDLAARAGAVVNLAGPYTATAEPVVEACLAAGTHYVDLAGEIPLVARSIARFHARAAQAGIKVVHACGFESMPPDVAILLAAQAAGGEPVAVDVEARLRPPSRLPRPSDLMSGGSLQSIAAVALAQGADPVDPAALVGDAQLAAAVRHTSPIPLRPRRGRDGGVLAPMVPAAFINPPVIHRSVELRAAPRGVAARPLRYREGLALAARPGSVALAAALAANQWALRRVARAPFAVRRRVGRALAAALPSSGYGPDPARLAGWSWEMIVDVETEDGRRVAVEVSGDGHPFYLTTARAVVEAGLLLAEPGATPAGAGCLTPASALGTERLDRFARAGLRFAVAAG